jgi:hypothetical protein
VLDRLMRGPSVAAATSGRRASFIVQKMVQKNRACIRVATLLRERVLRLALDCKAPRDAEFTST